MGCSTSSTAETIKQQNVSSVENSKVGRDSSDLEEQNSGIYPASESFVIPFNDSTEQKSGLSETPNESVTARVAKKPPKRILELMASTSEQSFSLRDSEEKLNKAEIRRKALLQQKIESIQKISQITSRQMK